MPIDYHPQPDQFRGKGTVWLAERVTTGELVEELAGGDYFYGYWDLEPDGPPTPLEDAGHHETLESALAWARKRMWRVLVRFRDTDYYWAGEGQTPYPNIRPLADRG